MRMKCKTAKGVVISINQSDVLLMGKRVLNAMDRITMQKCFSKEKEKEDVRFTQWRKLMQQMAVMI